MTLEITIELPDDAAEHMQAHLAEIRKPPFHDAGTGKITSEPRYVRGMELQQWIGELVGLNIAAELRDNPTPAMIEQRKKIEEAEAAIRQSIAPKVSVRKADAVANPTGR